MQQRYCYMSLHPLRKYNTNNERVVSWFDAKNIYVQMYICKVYSAKRDRRSNLIIDNAMYDKRNIFKLFFFAIFLCKFLANFCANYCFANKIFNSLLGEHFTKFMWDYICSRCNNNFNHRQPEGFTRAETTVQVQVHLFQ